jgi:hypothetical protein
MKSSDDLINNRNTSDISVEKSGRGESQNRFSPQLGKDVRKSAFSLCHLDAYNKVRKLMLCRSSSVAADTGTVQIATFIFKKEKGPAGSTAYRYPT